MDISLNSSESSFKPAQTDRTEGRWTNQEHQLFLQGLKVHGKNWKRIQSIVKTRTGSQIRSHAQKFFQKISDKRRSELSEESSQMSQLKGELSTSTIVSQNQPECSQGPSIQGMLHELKNTLFFIEQSGVNPLSTFSHYFFEIIKHPEELINNNFYGYFVDFGSTPTHNRNWDSGLGSRSVSFRPYNPDGNQQDSVCACSV